MKNQVPATIRTGVTKDISAWLQFSFWQLVLYLDHEEVWPASKERSGRWVGVTENIGDQLTYWILDEQSKQLLARSVVRPMNNNRRVKWDPNLTQEPVTQTKKDQTFKDGAGSLYIQAKDDTYRGASKLRYSNGSAEVNPYIRTFPWGKKVPYNQAPDLEPIPPSKDEFPQVEEQHKREPRLRKKPERLTYHIDTTQDHFAYNVSLDRMDEQGNSYSWEIQDILGHKEKRNQTMHMKVE